jgi:hydroxypyruvate isomerase
VAGVEKHGLICSLGQGVCTIPDGLNVKANHAQIEANFRHLLPACKKHGVPNLICFSGNRRDVSDEEAWDNCALLLNNVKAQAEDLGVTIVMELLNSKVNHKDYQCDKSPWGVEIVKRVGSPRFKLLYDIYHMQIMEGDVIRTIRENIDSIAHLHTGGNPGRHEIDETQELNYKAIALAIVDLNFQGYYAHEFIPTRDPMASLREAAALCDV